MNQDDWDEMRRAGTAKNNGSGDWIIIGIAGLLVLVVLGLVYGLIY